MKPARRRTPRPQMRHPRLRSAWDANEASLCRMQTSNATDHRLPCGYQRVRHNRFFWSLRARICCSACRQSLTAFRPSPQGHCRYAVTRETFSLISQIWGKGDQNTTPYSITRTSSARRTHRSGTLRPCACHSCRKTGRPGRAARPDSPHWPSDLPSGPAPRLRESRY